MIIWWNYLHGASMIGALAASKEMFNIQYRNGSSVLTEPSDLAGHT